MKFEIPLAKNVLLPLGITATASVADAIILKKFHRSGTATLVIGNKELEHIIKIIKSLEDLGVLIKGVTKTIANETKRQRWICWCSTRYFSSQFNRKYISW